MIHGWIMPFMLAVQLPAVTDLRPLFDAIRQVETGGDPHPANAIGDHGVSLGPYQIKKQYWRDSGVPGGYERVRERSYAERVMIAYWQRFCPFALGQGDWRTLARVHNGGPNGPWDPRTITYWQRVKRLLQE